MKSKFLFTILAAGSILTSCNMDLMPPGTIIDEGALETVNDAQKFRIGFYAGARGITSSSFNTSSDIQADFFNGLVVNGNRFGELANGKLFSNNSDVDGYWSSFWWYIQDINSFLENIDPVLEAYKDNEDEEYNYDRVNMYIAEAHFFRGYYYSMMFDRWCDLNDPNQYGLPIVTHYAPSADRDTYPSRASQKETLDMIYADLDAALAGLLAWEDKYPELVSVDVDQSFDGRLRPNAIYISSNVVKALQARIALRIGDYAKARTLAQEVIDCGIYTMSSSANFPAMWKSDTSTEIMYSPYEDTNELGAAIGNAWINNTNNADYIPNSIIIAELKAAGAVVDNFGRVRSWRDCRYTAYIDERTVKSAYGQITAPVFNKYPTNPKLMTGADLNYVNKPKPFRITEMYFIVAESAYELGDEPTANAMLKYYMEHRINYASGTGYNDLSGIALRDEIRKQRGLEFMGEGFRLSDLRRWKMGFDRQDGANYSGYDLTNLLTPEGLEVVYEPNDHRYTWPIPSDEFQVNPQMAGQQNPGY